MLLLLFSSLVWEGWLGLGIPSPLTEIESDDGVSATQTGNLQVLNISVDKFVSVVLLFAVISNYLRHLLWFVQVLQKRIGVR